MIDPNKLSTVLATEVEAAIKERSTAFDRDGNELEVLICLLLAMYQRLENHEADATSQSSNESRAAAVWSALSFQPSRSEPKLEALRDELMAKAQALVLASGESSRKRLEVPDFSIEDGDESEEEEDEESEEGDIAQFKEDFMAGTEATIVALRKCLLNNDPATCAERFETLGNLDDGELDIKAELTTSLEPPKAKPKFPSSFTLSPDEAQNLMSERYCHVVGNGTAPNAGRS